MSFCTMRTYSIINFGKYRGKIVSDVVATDPHYIKWALENTRSFPSQKLLDALKEKNITVNRKWNKQLRNEY